MAHPSSLSRLNLVGSRTLRSATWLGIGLVATLGGGGTEPLVISPTLHVPQWAAAWLSGACVLDYDRSVQVETLEEIAERLGWGPERLAEAREQLSRPRPSNISDLDRDRAAALSESVNRTRQALDEAS
jgi:hypothetical protein